MRSVIALVCALVLLSAVAAAADKISSQWKCDGKPADEKSMTVGDRDGHTYHLAQGKCTSEKPGSMGDAKDKEGAFTEFDDVNPNGLEDHGVFIATMSSGDTVFYHYRGKQIFKDGKMVSATNTWTLGGGTGKFKGVKGEGGCKGTPNADGSSSWACEGTYETAK